MCGLKNYFYVVIVVWLCFLVHVGSMCLGILRGEFFCITFTKTFLFWKKHLCSRAQIHRVFNWLLWEDAIGSVSYLRKLPTSKTPWLENPRFQLSPALGLEMFTNFRQLPITGELESGYLGGILWTLTCHFACKAVLKGTFDILIWKGQEKLAERERLSCALLTSAPWGKPASCLWSWSGRKVSLQYLLIVFRESDCI